jgi:hypothetical protein
MQWLHTYDRSKDLNDAKGFLDQVKKLFANNFKATWDSGYFATHQNHHVYGMALLKSVSIRLASMQCPLQSR